jgi:methionine-S-sulfoxide reductase
MSQKIGGIIVILILFIGWNIVTSNAKENVSTEFLLDGEINMVKKVIQSEEEWKDKLIQEKKTVSETATFAAGCFWGVEYKFGQLKGVLSTAAGYSGGAVKNPTYKQVCSDKTGHAEAVHIIYNPEEITYKELVLFFFKIHDPTQLNRQGLDVGSQYRSAIFYHDEIQKKTALKVIENLNTSKRYKKPITTQVVPYSEFYKAEEYHQKYYEKPRKKY